VVHLKSLFKQNGGSVRRKPLHAAVELIIP
jgi:hypothetical protein